MAVKSTPSMGSGSSRPGVFQNPKFVFAAALILADALLVSIIIVYVPYTKIDWDAYMSQVSGFLGGERDYVNLEGDTGPLVYPAGFLYVYSALKYVTAGEVFPAQWNLIHVVIISSTIFSSLFLLPSFFHTVLFGVLYIINLGIVFFIYVKTDVLPWWAFFLVCLSKRVHSIFVLRLFNDCIAVTLFHASLALLLLRKWHLGLMIFSGAVSVKMNILLYAPSLLLLMLKAMDITGVVTALSGAAAVQILLGLPFLISHPAAYISRAFNLGRVFIHFWSVNLKFVPENIFVSKEFALSLLIVHLILLMAFAHYRWCKHEGGLLAFIRSQLVSIKLQFFHRNSYNEHSFFKIIKNEHIVTIMFTGNFIGVLCARSLHYQFYSWYFYSIPYLLWRTQFPTLLRLVLLMGVELCWNVYPSNDYSSALLLVFHLIILWGLWSAPAEYPYIESKTSQKKIN